MTVKKEKHQKVKHGISFKVSPDGGILACQARMCINNYSFCCNLKTVTLDEKGKCEGMVKIKITKKLNNEIKKTRKN
jgi:hypothetical protein